MIKIYNYEYTFNPSIHNKEPLFRSETLFVSHTLNHKQLTKLHAPVKEYGIEVDDNWFKFFKFSESFRYFRIDSLTTIQQTYQYSVTEAIQKKSLFLIELRHNNIGEYVEREAYSILILFSDLGGVGEAIFAICFLVTYLPS